MQARVLDILMCWREGCKEPVHVLYQIGYSSILSSIFMVWKQFPKVFEYL